MGKHIKFDVRGVPIEPEGGWPQVKPPTKEELKEWEEWAKEWIAEQEEEDKKKEESSKE